MDLTGSLASQTLYPGSNSEGSFVHIDAMKIVAGMRSNYVIAGFCQRTGEKTAVHNEQVLQFV